jgi:hypothetical protein
MAPQHNVSAGSLRGWWSNRVRRAVARRGSQLAWGSPRVRVLGFATRVMVCAATALAQVSGVSASAAPITTGQASVTALADSVSGVLTDISLSPSGEGWAVGATGGRGLLIGIKGSALREQYLSEPGYEVNLTGITAPTPRSAWAVGYEQPISGGPPKGLLLRYDGARWAQIRIPGASSLAAVGALGQRDVWVAGTSTAMEPVAFEFDGRSWITRTLPAARGDYGSLAGVAVVAPDEVVVDGTMAGRLLADRWTGQTWVPLPTPSISTPGTNEGLDSVSGSSPTNIWLVGRAELKRQETVILFRLSGSTLTEPGFVYRDATIARVFTLGAGATWLSGVGANGDSVLYVTTGGSSWRVETPPAMSRTAGVLDGIAFTSATSGWVVGYLTSQSSGGTYALAARCSQGHWSTVLGLPGRSG